MNQAQIDLLVLEAQMGDEKAFEKLFKHFQQSSLRYAYKVVADPQIAQEATQNSWIKIAKNLTSLKDPRAFKSWLFRSVRWQVLDLIRKQQSQGTRVSIDEIDELIAPNTESKDSVLGDFIEQLGDIDKQMIHLFYLDDLSLIEISNVLSIPVGTVKSRLNKARKGLKQKLAEVTV